MKSALLVGLTTFFVALTLGTGYSFLLGVGSGSKAPGHALADSLAAMATRGDSAQAPDAHGADPSAADSAHAAPAGPSSAAGGALAARDGSATGAAASETHASSLPAVEPLPAEAIVPGQGIGIGGVRASMEPGRLAKLFAQMSAREAAKVLSQMNDQEIQTILTMLNDRQASAILGSLPPERAAAVSRLVITRSERTTS